MAQAQAIAPWVVEVRRQLHRIPETRFNEVKTAAAIKARLDEMHISYEGPFAITGVVATIGRGSPVVALRADIDALPIEETLEVRTRSSFAIIVFITKAQGKSLKLCGGHRRGCCVHCV